jgi:hypothetical protein
MWSAKRSTANREEKQMPQRRPGERPAGLVPPKMHPNPPVPEPRAVTFEPQDNREGVDPVRYGDWEKKGIAIDF